MLKHVAAIAVERECERLDFSVLAWNKLAIEFYRKMGARNMQEWQNMRLEGNALQELGASI